MGFSADGFVERPIRESSVARLSAKLRGISVTDVGAVIEQLPERDQKAINTFFGRLRSGNVDYLALSGSAALSRWSDLVAGNLDVLPQGFVLEFGASEVSASGEDDALTGISFDADWSRDRLRIRNFEGEWGGGPIPTTNLTIVGVSRFLEVPEAPIQRLARAQPGLTFLFDLIAVGTDDTELSSEVDFRVVPDLRVTVDYLQHPILGWPLEDALLVVEPLPGGIGGTLVEGYWGGVPVLGEIVYLNSPPRATLSFEAVDGHEHTAHTNCHQFHHRLERL